MYWTMDVFPERFGPRRRQFCVRCITRLMLCRPQGGRDELDRPSISMAGAVVGSTRRIIVLLGGAIAASQKSVLGRRSIHDRRYGSVQQPYPTVMQRPRLLFG